MVKRKYYEFLSVRSNLVNKDIVCEKHVGSIKFLFALDQKLCALVDSIHCYQIYDAASLARLI